MVTLISWQTVVSVVVLLLVLTLMYAVWVALSPDRDRAEPALAIVKELLATVRWVFTVGRGGGQ
ncbi:hypothetical protein ABIC28_003459 [Rhodococcus sp. PvR044]|jgi:hypothetical protein|uniref:hypothetical protein n=1 Tax=Rhodococcus sp. PvR044 TaxID=3156402 RepID=UPI003399925E